LPPRSQPLPGAIDAFTTSSVVEATRAAAYVLQTEGIGVQQVRTDTGLVESAWYDIALLVPSARDYPADERMVRFRFVAQVDTTRARTHMWLETLQALNIDPLGGRRRERHVPSDHPAMATARRLLERVESRLGEP
jgi:hypothetical protein